MPEPPRITLITASFNRAHMIGDMLASVAAQAFPPVQHLVMDGGSTDGTVELLRNRPGIELHVAPDKGVYDAWNKARPLVRGDWVIYLNSDDLLPAGAFAAYAAALQARPEARIITGTALLSDLAGHEHGRRSEGEAQHLTLATLRLRGCILNARLIQRSLIDAAGDLDLSLHPASDLDLLIRIARISPPAAYVPAPTYSYRKHDGSITLGRAAQASMRAPRMGLDLLDRLLADPMLAVHERAAVLAWRRSYLDTLLSRAHWQADRASFVSTFQAAVRAAPGATLRHLVARSAGRKAPL
jgi:glycosyltransferase involved in cell wall biosynthesis